MTPVVILLFISVVVTLNGVDCSGNLNWKFLNELTCPKDPVPLYTGKVNYLWLLFPSIWYIPMASLKSYCLSAQVLLGRPAQNTSELDLLNLRVKSFVSTYKIIGFENKSFRKVCAPINRPATIFPRNLLENTCFGLWGTQGNDVESIAKAVDTIVWTDNVNAVLITPCVNNNYDWFVLAKQSNLSAETKELILKIVTKLGFNPNNAAYYDYENKRLVRANHKMRLR